MKLSTISSAFVVTLAASALSLAGASAATTITTSKSNSSEVATKACTDAGGTAYTNKDGGLVCAQPTGAKEIPCLRLGILCVTAAQVTTIKGSKSNGDARVDPSKACTDAGGEVLTDAAGEKYCLMPKPATPALKGAPTPTAAPPAAPTKEGTH